MRIGAGIGIAVALLVAGLLPGCRSTYNAEPADPDEIATEGSLVFVRPGKYSILGTQNIADHVEVIYENPRVNEAGQPVVEIGLRNKGGQHWWDVRGNTIALHAKAEFYDTPVKETGPTGPPRYDSGWQTIVIRVGATTHHAVTSPVKDLPYHRITLSIVR